MKYGRYQYSLLSYFLKILSGTVVYFVAYAMSITTGIELEVSSQDLLVTAPDSKCDTGINDLPEEVMQRISIL